MLSIYCRPIYFCHQVHCGRQAQDRNLGGVSHGQPGLREAPHAQDQRSVLAAQHPGRHLQDRRPVCHPRFEHRETGDAPSLQR